MTTAHSDCYPTLTKAYNALVHIKACKAAVIKIREMVKQRVFARIRNEFIKEWAPTNGGIPLCQNVFKLSERRLRQILSSDPTATPIPAKSRLREDPTLWIKQLELNLVKKSGEK